MATYVQYRYKGRLISAVKAASLSRLKGPSKYITSYYRETWRGKSSVVRPEYHTRTGLKTIRAIERDREERQKAIEKKAAARVRAREREEAKTFEYQKKAFGPYEEFEKPTIPITYVGPGVELPDAPALDDEDWIMYDYFDDALDMADIDDPEYPEE